MRLTNFFDSAADLVTANAPGLTIRGGTAPTFRPTVGSLVQIPFKRNYLSHVNAAATDNTGIVTFDAMDSVAGRALFEFLTIVPLPLCTTQRQFIYARGQGAGAVTDFYRVKIDVGAATLSIEKYTGAALSTVATVGYAWNAAKAYFVWFAGNGPQLQVQVWEAPPIALPVRPVALDIDVRDAAPLLADGWFGFSGYHATLTGKISAFNFASIATGGQSAVVPLTNSEWFDSLRRPNQLRVITAVLQAIGYDYTGSPYTKTVRAYLSDIGYQSQAHDSPPQKNFRAILQGVPTYTTSMGVALTGRGNTTFGNAVVDNKRRTYRPLAAALKHDFTTGQLADSILGMSPVVTRAGATATRINQAGYIEMVAANTARFSHEPVPSAGDRTAWMLTPGIAGNYGSTPDTAAVSPAVDVEIIAKVTVVDLAAGGFQLFQGKWVTTANQRSFLFGVAASVLFFYISTTGADSPNVAVALPAGFVNGTYHFKVNRVKATGATNFSYSLDGVTFTLIGAQQILSAGSAIFDSTAPLVSGAYDTGGVSGLLTGRIHRSRLFTTIGGAAVADFDASRFAAGGVSAVMVTGETWTVNQAGTWPAWIEECYSVAACMGLLVEEARTNLLLQSNSFGTTWAPAGTPAPTQNLIGPDGAAGSAWTVTDNDAAAYEGVTQALVVPNDALTRSFSLLLRKNPGATNTFGMNLSYNGGAAVSATPRVNTSTGAVQNSGAVVTAGAGWWRFYQALTNNASGNTAFTASLYAATAVWPGGDSVTGQGSTGLYGAQLEVGAFRTSYIPTGAATATRAADAITYSDIRPFVAVGVGGSIQGTIVVEFIPGVDDTHGVVTFNDGTANNVIEITVVAGVMSCIVKYLGVTYCNITGGAWQANKLQRIAFAYGGLGADFAAVSFNGGAVVTDNSGVLPLVIDRMALGVDQAGNYLNGHLVKLTVYRKRHSNADLVTMASGGTALAEMPGREFDPWANASWSRSFAEFRMGDPARPYHDHRTIIRARLGRPQLPSADSLSFPLAGMSQGFDQPLVTQRFAAGNYIDQFNPKLFGLVNGRFEPPQIDSGLYVYALDDGLVDATNAQAFDVDSHIIGIVTTMAFTNTVANINTAANHGMVLKYRVRFPTGSTVPAPYALNTDYFVVAFTANTCSLSATVGGAPIVAGGTVAGVVFNSFGYYFTLSGAGSTVTLAAKPTRLTIGGLQDDTGVANEGNVAQMYDEMIFGALGFSRNYKDPASFASLETYLGAIGVTAGLWFDTQKHLGSEALAKLSNGTMTWYGDTPDGFIRVGLLGRTIDAAVVFTEDDIKPGSLKRVDVIRPIDMSKAQVSCKPWFLTGGPMPSANQEALQGKVFLPALAYGAPSTALESHPELLDSNQAATFDLVVNSGGGATNLQQTIGVTFQSQQGVYTVELRLHAMRLGFGDAIQLKTMDMHFADWNDTDPVSPNNPGNVGGTGGVVLEVSPNLTSDDPYKVTVKFVRVDYGYFPMKDLT